MLKKLTLTLLVCLTALSFNQVNAQKWAIVDTEYIMKNIPEYGAAQQKLNDLSKQWEQEISDKIKEVETLYKNYQADKIILSAEMQTKREEEITSKEREIAALKKQRFGKDGDLQKERIKLIKPIQDKIYNAIKDLAEKGHYAAIFDKASELSVLYTDPKYDVSDEVLKALGYK